MDWITTSPGKYTPNYIFGWSGGYLGFQYRDPDPNTGAGAALSALASTDGLHWTKTQSLRFPTDASHHSVYQYVTNVVRGGSTFLAAGWPGSSCGPSSVAALWRSTDGRTWTLVNIAAAFGGGFVVSIEGGSSGFIATGLGSDGGQPIWTSVDGLSWHRSQAPAIDGTSVYITGATSFSDGFVLAGLAAPVGCVGGLQTPTVWWSADGSGWTKGELPGVASAGSASVSVSRVSDHLLLAMAYAWDEKTQTSSYTAWTSSDGRTWTSSRAASAAAAVYAQTLYAQIVSDDDRGVLFQSPSHDSGPASMWAFEEDLTLVPLHQTGLVPSVYVTPALGPVGLVATDSVTGRIYLGILTNSLGCRASASGGLRVSRRAVRSGGNPRPLYNLDTEVQV